MTWYQRAICLAAAVLFAVVVWPWEGTGDWRYPPFAPLRGLVVVACALFILAAVRPNRPPQ